MHCFSPEGQREVGKLLGQLIVAKINEELGLVWRSIERLETHVEWIKSALWKVAAPILIGTFLAVLGVLLKLLLA